ncbi:hypothetical protein RCL1_000593 [Eukaryota sp. TZLM3-RCL]
MLFKLLEELLPESMGFTWIFAMKSDSVRKVPSGEIIDTFFPSFEWRPDIALFHSKLKIPLLIVEVKNEQSSKTGSDPLAQCIMYYCQFISRKDSTHHCFGCPCFLMLSDGTHIYIYGVTVHRDNEIRCSLLFDFEFSIHSYCAVFIRAFEILKQSIIMLVNEFYDFFSDTGPETILPSQRLKLWIFKRNTPALLRRYWDSVLAFPSNFKISGGAFVSLLRNKNSIEAQCVLAKLGHSPLVQQVTKIGDWYAVFSQDASELSHRVAYGLKESLTKFHQMGFVHGDVRDCNLVNGYLIDFETAGLVGYARYPITWNVVRTVDRRQFYQRSPFPFTPSTAGQNEMDEDEKDSDEEKIYPGIVLFDTEAYRVDWHPDVARLETIFPGHDDYTYSHVKVTSVTKSSHCLYNLSSMISPKQSEP